MFAIVETNGQQLKVEKGQKILVNDINQPEGSIINLDKVLLISSGTDLKLGMPWLNGAYVEGKVISHEKGEKVRVFKMKPKRRYKKTKGHRSRLSTLEIIDIKEVEIVRKTEVKDIKEKNDQSKSTVKKSSAKKSTGKTTSKQRSLLEGI